MDLTLLRAFASFAYERDIIFLSHKRKARKEDHAARAHTIANCYNFAVFIIYLSDGRQA
jgi:hypothetical protein